MAGNKFEEAQKRAREREEARKNGTGEVATPDSETALAVTAQQQQMALQSQGMLVDASVVMDKLASGDWEAAPQIFDIPDGGTLIGILEGHGIPAELPDPRTREMKTVETWILRSQDNEGVRVSILTTAQLDKKLPPFVGQVVSITKADMIETSTGRRCQNFLVAGPKNKDKPRDWSGKPPTTNPQAA